MYLLEVFTLAHYGPPSTETPTTTIAWCHKTAEWFNKYLLLVTFETNDNYSIRFEMKKKHYSHSTINQCRKHGTRVHTAPGWKGAPERHAAKRAYTMTATAMKAWKTNSKLCTVKLDHLTSLDKFHQVGCHCLWPSLLNPGQNCEH